MIYRTDESENREGQASRRGDLAPLIEGIAYVLDLSEESVRQLEHFLAWLTLSESLWPEVAAQMIGKWEMTPPEKAPDLL